MKAPRYLHRIVGAYDEARNGSGAKVPAKLRTLLVAVDQAVPAGYWLSPYLFAGETPRVQVLLPNSRDSVAEVEGAVLTIMDSLTLEALPAIDETQAPTDEDDEDDGGDEGETRIGTPVAEKTDKRTPTAEKPKTKAARTLELIKRKRGATTADLIKATGWLPHTLRAHIAVEMRRKGGLDVRAERSGKVTTYRLAPPASGQTQPPCIV